MQPSPIEAPSPRRWWILFLLFAAITINILDRQVLSLVAPVLREQFHLSNTQYGAIVFCFLLGMTLGQIPVGMMMDRIGARIGLAAISVFWSAANMLHAFAGSTFQFGALRFMLGLGECGNYSAGVKVIAHWFPPRDRAFAGGLFNSGSLAGAIIAPPLIVFLTLRLGWQAAFLLPSTIGFVWALVWLRSGHRDAPAAKSDTVPLLPLFAVPAMWGVVLMRAFGGPVTHFYWYWLPEYLKNERGLSLQMIGIVAWLPFFFGGVGNIGGGWFSGLLMRRGCSVDRARKTAFCLSVALCLVAVLVTVAPNAAAAIALICLATLGINAFAANLMALISDLFPQKVLARASGITGVGDGAMSMLSMLATGIVVDRFSYLPIFVAAGLFPVAALAAFFFLVRKVERVRLYSGAES